MEYVLSYEKMALDTPNTQKGTKTKRQSAKKGTVSNKDNISNKDKEEITTTKVVGDKSPSENSTEIVEDKRNTDVQLILDTIEANHGTVDGTIKDNRQYAYLLSKKIKKMPGFEKFGDVGNFVQAIIKNSDEFTVGKTTSPKKLYYDLGTVIAKIKAKNKTTPKKTVTYG